MKKITQKISTKNDTQKLDFQANFWPIYCRLIGRLIGPTWPIIGIGRFWFFRDRSFTTPTRLVLATAVDYLILFILGIEGTGKSQMESFKLINGLLLQCTDDWGFWWIKLKLCRAYFLGFVEPFEFKHPTQVKILLCLDMKLKCLKWVSFSRYSIQL